MKKNLLLTFAFAALLLGSFSLVSAQPTPCTVDLQYTSPGIYPNDTLLDMNANVATQQVVQFVFPSDTVIFGQTLPFDSFLVDQVTSIPNGLDWQCNANHPVCHYVSTPGQLTRGCVTMYGTPTAQSASFPAYDSIIVTGTAYITLFGQPFPISQDISVYYRIDGTVGASAALASNSLQIAPSPVMGESKVNYTLNFDATVKVTVMDLMGREVAVLFDGMQRQGENQIAISSKDLASGAYLLKLSINNGEFVQTKKFTSVR
jgi:hypothetical protein